MDTPPEKIPRNSVPHIFQKFYLRITDRLLGAIGKKDDDSKQFGDIYITRGEVKYTISNENNYYTADFIWILIYSFNKEKLSKIKVYPGITIEKTEDYFQQILSQDKNYAFMPINIAYDNEKPTHKNHWVALIIDKQHQLIFYLDPAKKRTIPAQIEELNKRLNYKNAIILNPIDFQQKEKQEGWIRHCGAYVVEIFKAFQKAIQNGKCISGSQLPNTDIINDSLSLQTSLSEIPCGEAEIIFQIRNSHIKEACEALGINLKELSEIQNTPSESSQGLRNYLGHDTKIMRNTFPDISSSNSSSTLGGPNSFYQPSRRRTRGPYVQKRVDIYEALELSTNRLKIHREKAYYIEKKIQEDKKKLEELLTAKKIGEDELLRLKSIEQKIDDDARFSNKISDEAYFELFKAIMYFSPNTETLFCKNPKKNKTAVDGNNHTFLYHAISFANFSAAIFLRKNGISMDDESKSLLDVFFSVYEDDKEMLTLLTKINSENSEDYCFDEKYAKAFEDIITHFQQEKFDENDLTELKKFIGDNRAIIHFIDKEGNNILHHAVECLCLHLNLHYLCELIKFLVNEGADFDKKNNINTTPRELAGCYGVLSELEKIISPSGRKLT